MNLVQVGSDSLFNLDNLVSIKRRPDGSVIVRWVTGPEETLTGEEARKFWYAFAQRSREPDDLTI